MARIVAEVDDLVLVNNIAMIIIYLKNEEGIQTQEKVIVEVNRREGKVFRTIQNHLAKL